MENAAQTIWTVPAGKAARQLQQYKLAKIWPYNLDDLLLAVFNQAGVRHGYETDRV